MQTIALYLLFTLCVGIVDSRPAALRAPDCDDGCLAHQEVYPIALRYRQQIDEKLHLLLLHPSGLCPPAPEERAAQVHFVAHDAMRFPDTTLSYLLVRMQF